MTAPLDWSKSVPWLANVGHLMAGGHVALITWLFTHSKEMIWIVEVIFFITILTKEYVADLLWESGETVGSSTIDALGWFGGNAVAWGLVWLASYVI
jgi:hypothetical protein